MSLGMTDRVSKRCCTACDLGYPGEMLIRALEELILPLIVFALMVGILNLRHTPGG